ncbi:MAG: hypothetical protein QM639_14165, partial [Rhodocyclaceae bacterium]
CRYKKVTRPPGRDPANAPQQEQTSMNGEGPSSSILPTPVRKNATSRTAKTQAARAGQASRSQRTPKCEHQAPYPTVMKMHMKTNAFPDVKKDQE